MRRYVKIVALLTCTLTVTFGFQNCAEKSNETTLSDLSSPVDAGTDSTDGLSVASEIDPNFSNPGIITGLRVEDGKLYMAFHKGLKKKVQQGLGSRTRYYYSKWNFFVNGQYLTTWESNGACGDTKQSECEVYSFIENYTVLKALRGQNITVTLTTLHEGLQSPRTDGMSVDLPGVQQPVADENTPDQDVDEDDEEDESMISKVCPEADQCPTGKFAIEGRSYNGNPLVVYILSTKGKFCAYNRAEPADQSIPGDDWLEAVITGEVLWDQVSFTGGHCGE